MSTPYRFIPEEAKRWTDHNGQPIAVVEVTIRTILGIYLLKPTLENTSLILGILGRAKALLPHLIRWQPHLIRWHPIFNWDNAVPVLGTIWAPDFGRGVPL